MNLRILKIFQANFIGQILLVIIQIGSIPIFLKYWGKENYGEWLILTTLPSYLSITDFGISSVIGNEMTMLAGKNKIKQANLLFRQTWGWIIMLSLCLIFILGLTAYYTNFFSSDFKFIDTSTIPYIILLLSISVFINIQIGLCQGIYRTFHKYHIAINFNNFFRLIEFGGLVLLVTFQNKAINLALFTCLSKIAFLLITLIDIHFRYRKIIITPIFTRFNLLKPHVKTALYFALIPIGQGLIFQGSTAIIGYKLGSVAVVTYNTTRTITSSIRQFSGLMNNSIWNEFSILYGQGKILEMYSLFIRFFQLSVTGAITFLLILNFGGIHLMKIWTLGNVTIQQPFFILMLLVLVGDSMWHTAQVLVSSINKHENFSKVFVFGAFICAVFCYFLVPFLKLSCIPIGFLLFDSFLIWISFKSVMDIFKEAGIILKLKDLVSYKFWQLSLIKTNQL